MAARAMHRLLGSVVCITSASNAPSTPSGTRHTTAALGSRTARGSGLRPERYRKNPEINIETARRSRVRKQYGLTLEEYEARLAEGCSICGEHGPRMAMDHCHATGKVREPLCANCNNGLGRFFDKPELLRAAADYLERHSP